MFLLRPFFYLTFAAAAAALDGVTGGMEKEGRENRVRVELTSARVCVCVSLLSTHWWNQSRPSWSSISIYVQKKKENPSSSLCFLESGTGSKKMDLNLTILSWNLDSIPAKLAFFFNRRIVIY